MGLDHFLSWQSVYNKWSDSEFQMIDPPPCAEPSPGAGTSLGQPDSFRKHLWLWSGNIDMACCRKMRTAADPIINNMAKRHLSRTFMTWF